jgi:PII-like signaling protein
MEMNVKKTKVRRISLQLPTVQIIVDQKEVENVDYFSSLDSLVTNDARYTCEIKCRIAMAEAALNKRRLSSPANLTYI